MVPVEEPSVCVCCKENAVASNKYCADCLEWEVCDVCGNDNLQIQAWVLLNGPNALDFVASCEEETAWCSKCEEHRTTTTRSEFFRLSAIEAAESNETVGGSSPRCPQCGHLLRDCSTLEAGCFHCDRCMWCGQLTLERGE